LSKANIPTDWHLSERVWREAAGAYKGYAERRRAQKGDQGPRRILADFLIGAHAQVMADALLTFDEGVYKAAFPGLELKGL